MPKRLWLQLVGAQGVGKTSLLKAVSNRLFDVYPHYYFEELSRPLLADKSVSALDVLATNDDQLLITTAFMLQYIKALASPYQLILAERTSIDCLAYTRHLSNPSLATLRLTGQFVIDTNMNCGSNMDTVTIYVPPKIPFVVDGVRREESQKAIDKEVVRILNEFGIVYDTLEVVDREERVAAVIGMIVEHFCEDDKIITIGGS